MKPLRYFTVTFCLTILLALTSCDFNPGDSDEDVGRTDIEVRESFSFQVDVGQHVRFDLNAINGTVEVSGVPNSTTIVITGERIVGSDSEEDARAYLDQLQVKLTDLTTAVLVETLQPEDAGGRNLVVNYQVTVPDSFDVDVVNINGVVTVRELNGSVDADNVNGNIYLHDICGDLAATVVNGLIDARVGSLPQDGRIRMTTVNGNISLAIPATTSAEFSAGVTNGRINMGNLTLQNPVSTPTSLRGRLGDGSGSITLQTVNGNVNVSGS